MLVKAKFRDYEHGATKGFVDFFVNGAIVVKGATLVEGRNGFFVSMPSIKVHDEYRDVITGVSKEFSEKLLEVALAAKNSEVKEASIGTGRGGYYDVHVGVIPEPKGAAKALASLTVRQSKEAEKSCFTINGIRVNQGEKNLFLGMPSKKTGNEQYPYAEVCTFLGDSKAFLDNLILAEAKDKLGIKKKASLNDRMKGAEEKSMQQQDPASIAMSMGRESAMSK